MYTPSIYTRRGYYRYR